MSDKKTSPEQGYSRRRFLTGGALLGAGFLPRALVGEGADGGDDHAVLISRRPDAPYELGRPENILYSSCLQCNTGCGIKAKLQDGVLTKIDGNPYSPWTMTPHLPYGTAFDDAAPVDGALCPKGQAGLQTAYDPYRIRRVLKRSGKRGENKWVSIPFAQAIEEIVEGGVLFGSVPGEERRHVDGLRTLSALRDTALSAQMAADVKALWDEKDRTKKQALVDAFRVKHAEHLDLLIDPAHPDFGPKNNQIILNWGRAKAGRSDFYRRFAAGLGTRNAYGHTTVCQGSLYFTCKAISEQWENGKFTGGQKFYWQADDQNARFILFVGANLFEGNYGPTNRTPRLTANLASGRTRIAVVDPRFNKLASKAWKFLPAQPGTDAALAFAMMRWIFEEQRYDAKFLSCANKAAAKEAGEGSWSNATWLVEIRDGTPGALVRAADIGAAVPETRRYMEGKDEKEYEEKFFVAMVNGAPVPIDPNSEEKPVFGDLFVDTVLPGGMHVKSGLQLLLESAMEHGIEEWCQIAECKARDVVEVARELTSHGKAVAIDVHRGPSQHTNGFYNVFAWMSLSMLLGNFDAKGGMVKPTTYDVAGKGGLFAQGAQPGKINAFGISHIRDGIDYEKTTLFSGYPARRNWYPLASDMYQEVIPSIGDQYPYAAKAYFLYMGAPTYSLPAGHRTVEILSDLDKMPLFVANDILVGTSSMYADYVFPDLSFLERWEFQGSHPNIVNKVQPVRQPVIAPIPEECTVYGQTMPICFESMMLGIAERLELPGFGADGFGPDQPLRHYDDLYLRGVANLAFGEKPDAEDSVPDADAREMEVFLQARRHLPTSVFDAARWRAIVGEAMWPKVVYVLNRGGRFQDHDRGYKAERLGNPYGKQLNLYQEKTAKTIHAGTGRKYPGIARYIPVQTYLGDDLARYREGYPLRLITHRTISQTKTRTIGNPWLTPLMPENGVLINGSDARELGVEHGDLVRVSSATNAAGEWTLGAAGNRPMTGKAIVTQTIRPGVVSFALGFGHWATGAADMEIDGQMIRGEKRRQAGINANAAMWTDPAFDNTCLIDPIGGSVSFYDTWVRLEKA
jgi:tetrathionate reductase subunit A